MAFRRILWLSAALAMLALGEPAFAQGPAKVSTVHTYVVAGRTLSLPLVEGQCLLNHDRLDDNAFITVTQAMIGKDEHRILDVFAPCATLDEWRSGRAVRLADYGVLTTPLRDGEETHIPDVNRPAYIAPLARAVVNTDWEALKVASNEALKATGSDTRIETIEETGAFQSEKLGLFIRLIERFRFGDERQALSEVRAATLANQAPVGLFLYRSSADDTTQTRILREAAEILRRVIHASEKPAK